MLWRSYKLPVELYPAHLQNKNAQRERKMVKTEKDFYALIIWVVDLLKINIKSYVMFWLGMYHTFARNPLSDAKGGFLSKSMETSLSASLLVINPHCEALIGMIAAFFKTSICSGVQVEQYI